MSNIGILAYGSLIDCPDEEIKAITVSAPIKNVQTPFKVEFARASGTRNGAPSLIPVIEGGAKVKAVIIVLENSVSEREAVDILWRRETWQVGSGRRYNPPSIPGLNTVLVERIRDFFEVDIVLYTKIASNIDNPSPELLADLAIRSAQAEAGERGKDGISYLISAKQSGIVTPLMPEYENEILRRTGAKTLEDAHARARMALRPNV
jgi:hypothetical protein